MRSIYMHAWDLDGVHPRAVAGELRALGLDTCSLAFAYHGGRMLLPRGRRGRVRELDPGAVYFAADPARYGQLRPHVAPEAALVPAFVRACGDVGVAVNAWVVVCHNERLGAAHPECCVENVYGDRYPYALCPSHPEVRRYAAALCADVAAAPGLARLELEALGFLGLDHASLHDKRGVPLGAPAAWLLSVCVCRWCRLRVGEPIDAFAARAPAWLDRHLAEPAPPVGDDLRAALAAAVGAGALDALLEGRRQVVASLLDEVREATGALHLNVRLAPDPLFIGGKTVLGWPELAARADSATVTFFGAPLARMRDALQKLPPAGERGLPVYGGFVFHAPDCASEADVRQRVALLREAGVDGVSAYCLGLAAEPQLAWLAAALASDGAVTAVTSTPSSSEVHA